MKQLVYTLALLTALATANINGYSQSATRHDFVKRNGATDMAIGNYTVLATANSEADAKQSAQDIQKAGHTGVDVGYLSIKKLWYVHVSSANDVEKARVTRDKFRKTEQFKDAWVLTVHE